MYRLSKRMGSLAGGARLSVGSPLCKSFLGQVAKLVIYLRNDIVSV